MIFLVAALCIASPQNESKSKLAKHPPAAPVPAGILDSKTVFISNVGTGCEPFAFQLTPGQYDYTDGSIPAYDAFYNAMRSWGHYALVGRPEDAQLDFEIGFTCPLSISEDGFAKNYRYPDPQLRLVIRNVKTNVVLWEITQHVASAILDKNRASNLNRGVSELAAAIKRLVDTRSTAASPQPSD